VIGLPSCRVADQNNADPEFVRGAILPTMKVRYFHLDENDCLQKVAQRHLEAVWFDERPWDDSASAKPLRLISFLCDDDFRPLRGFVMRVQIREGRLTDDSRHDAIAAVQSAMPPLPSIFGPVQSSNELPLIDKQLEGWPEPNDLFRQLAVALDVPIEQVPPLRFGGPLLTATLLRVTVKQALTYYEIESPD